MSGSGPFSFLDFKLGTDSSELGSSASSPRYVSSSSSPRNIPPLIFRKEKESTPSRSTPRLPIFKGPDDILNTLYNHLIDYTNTSFDDNKDFNAIRKALIAKEKYSDKDSLLRMPFQMGKIVAEAFSYPALSGDSLVIDSISAYRVEFPNSPLTDICDLFDQINSTRATLNLLEKFFTNFKKEPELIDEHLDDTTGIPPVLINTAKAMNKIQEYYKNIPDLFERNKESLEYLSTAEKTLFHQADKSIQKRCIKLLQDLPPQISNDLPEELIKTYLEECNKEDITPKTPRTPRTPRSWLPQI